MKNMYRHERSPSARREWIEIIQQAEMPESKKCLPLRGGSGLKSPQVLRQMGLYSLPLRGGSGLKLFVLIGARLDVMSPSARREWIEILVFHCMIYLHQVSLCEEGVD